MKQITGRFIMTVLSVCGLWLATAMSSVFAADFIVNDTSDAVDINPGNGVCEATASGADCTLRAAIMESNALAGADTIALPAGTYNLTLTGVDELCENVTYYSGSGTATPCTNIGTPGDPVYVPTITSDASKGDLDINDDLVITGEGSDVTTVQWAEAAPDADPLTGDRIFHIAVAAGATANITSVVIEGLTAVNGDVGIIATSATGGDLVIPDDVNAYDIEVVDTTAGSIEIWQFRRMGGAIALGAGYGVVLYEEALHGPDAPSGGGVDMGPFPGGKPGEEEGFSIENVTLNDVIVINSWSGADGGGIYSAAPATISESIISGNISNANGGGIYNDAVLTISDSLVGKVFDTATAALHPELTNPNIGENGGGMFDTGSHTTTILSSAINGNEAIGGGGIAARALITVNLTNTTISGNTGTDVGGGITTNGTVNLNNVTVADNVATTDAPGGGGGLNSFGSGTYTLYNTLLTNNNVSGRTIPLSNCGCSGGSASCPSGRMVSQGYNLEDGNSCSLSLAGDQINTDPLIEALADNGGLTETHLIPHSAIAGVIDSPAIDAGSNVDCPNNDQRGSIRPADGDGNGTTTCDIGAFELFETTTDLQIENMVAPDEVFKGDNYTVTVTITNGAVAADGNVVYVTDALPNEVSYVSATAAGGDVNNCTEAAGVVTCTIGTLAGTSSATVTLTLTAATVGNAIVTGSVSSDNDVTPENNSASVSTTVIGESDLQLSATANRSSVVIGREVSVTFTVANLGADDASTVRLSGTMPPEVTLISATPDNGTSCTQTDADVLCALGDLAVAGPTINIVVVLRGDNVGTIADVSATVEAIQRDTDESNNTATASVKIINTSSDGGGFCSYHPDGRFDPVLPAMVLIGLAYFAWRRRVTQ